MCLPAGRRDRLITVQLVGRADMNVDLRIAQVRSSHENPRWSSPRQTPFRSALELKTASTLLAGCALMAGIIRVLAMSLAPTKAQRIRLSVFSMSSEKIASKF